MKFFERLALSATIRRLGLCSLLSVASLAHADIEGGGPLVFDVPEPGESITINLLQMRSLDPNWFLFDTQFIVSPFERPTCS